MLRDLVIVSDTEQYRVQEDVHTLSLVNSWNVFTRTRAYTPKNITQPNSAMTRHDYAGVSNRANEEGKRNKTHTKRGDPYVLV